MGHSITTTFRVLTWRFGRGSRFFFGYCCIIASSRVVVYLAFSVYLVLGAHYEAVRYSAWVLVDMTALFRRMDGLGADVYLA